MNARDLLERRAVIVAEMRGITEKPAGAGGDLSAEQSAKFDSLKGELEGIEKRIDRQRLIDEAERRMAGQQIAGSGDSRLDDELRTFSLRRAICSMVPDLAAQVDSGRERELSAELARRAGRPFQGVAVPMSVFHRPIEKRTITSAQASPDAGGSNIVGTDHRGDLYIDALRARLVVRRLGARVLSGLMGNVDIPKLSASATSGWVAEDSALTSVDPTFAKVQLTPKNAGALAEFSRNVLLQSSPDVEQLLRSDFAAILANALDVAAINGSGGTDPTGILNTSSVDTSTVAAPLTWAKVLQLIELVENANAEGNGWVTTPGVVRLLRSTAKVTSTDSVMIMQERDSLAGYPLQATQNVPRTLGSPATDHALIFGNWADLLIGFWSELDVLVNPYETTAYSKGNVKIRAMMTCDIAVRHAESFAACVDVTP
ncbi:MAG: phage major capsid protein [Burkholderiales bacterium]|nr:phage major capsid protein [Burkholderiales bacterium]